MWHWHIGDVKRNARRYLAGSYWKTVLVALVLAIIGSSGNSGLSCAGTLDHITEWAESGGPGSSSWSFSWGSSHPFHEFHSGHFGFPFIGGSSGLRFGAPFFGGMLLLGILAVILCVIIAAAAFGVKIFLFNPIESGCQRFFAVNHVESGRTSLGEMFHSFNGKYYLNVVKTLFLRDLYLILWSLLFVIPGIVKSYSYRLVPYILAEQPDMDHREAFRLSREMMDGNKWHAFCLDLSFIGWEILNICTLGILGIFYVGPYRATANAEMYIAIRDEYFHR